MKFYVIKLPKFLSFIISKIVKVFKRMVKIKKAYTPFFIN